MGAASGNFNQSMPVKLSFRKVLHSWNSEDLLTQTGWFPLPDVMRLLDPNLTGQYKRILVIRERMLKQGMDPNPTMGLKPFGNRIWAWMPTFSTWYGESEGLQVSRIPKNWSLEVFLHQSEGIYSLRGVLEILPKSWPIRYPAMKNLIAKSEDPRKEYGAAKLEGAGYVVFMPHFGNWLKAQVQ